MAQWQEIEQACGEFAQRVKAVFDSGTNKTLATIRRDGSPRVSGTELVITDGRVTLGMMPQSVKLADVRRDPRVAVHSPTLEPPAEQSAWPGEAKMSGVLIEVAPPEDNPVPGASFFELIVRDVALTRLGTPADHLVIESWSAGSGYQRRTRT